MSVFRKHWINIALITLFSLFICRNFFFSSGIVAGNEILGWVGRTEWFSNDGNVFHLWSTWLGYGNVQLTGLHIPLAVLNSIIQNPALVIKLFILFTLLISGITMYIFVYSYQQQRLVAIIAAYLFLTSQFLMTRLTSGHLSHFLGFALAPIVLYTFDQAIKQGRLRWISFFSLTIAVLILFTRLDLPYYYAPLLTLFLVITLAIPPKNIRRTVLIRNFGKVLIIGLPLILLLSAFQFMPILFGARPEYLSTTLSMPWEELSWWSLSLYESLIGFSREMGVMYWLGSIRWDSHPFLGYWQYILVMSIIPVLSFSTLFIKRNRVIIFFSAAALTAAFLAKGPNEPFEVIYLWIYEHIPFFNLVKTPNRWVAIVNLSYSFLAAVFISTVFNKLWGFRNRLFKLSQKSRLSLRHLYSVVLLILLVSILSCPLFGIWYVIYPGIENWEPTEQEILPHHWLAQQDGDFRVATVPYFQEYMKNDDGFWNNDLGSMSGIWSDKTVLWLGGWKQGNDYNFTSYTNTLIFDNETDQLGKILGTFNIKYIVLQGYPPTEVKLVHENADISTQKEFFKKQAGLKQVYKLDDVSILENTYWTDHVFATSKYYMIVGGREAFTNLLPINKILYTDNCFLFADQIINTQGIDIFSDLLRGAEAMVFVNTEIRDLAFLTLDNVVRLKANEFPLSGIPWYSSNSNVTRDEEWVGNHEWVNKGDFIQSSQTIYTKGTKQITNSFSIIEDGAYEIWVRLYFGPDRGKLNININDVKLGEITAYSTSYSGMKWERVGIKNLRSGSHQISLQNNIREIDSFPGSTDIDEIVIVKPDTLAQHTEEIINLISENSNKIIHILQERKIQKWINDIDLSTGQSINITNNNQTSFWQNPNLDYVRLSNDKTATVVDGSINSLLVEYRSGRQHTTLIEKTFESPQNWGQDDYFSLWFKGQGSNETYTFIVSFGNSNSNYVQYNIKDTSNEWIQLFFTKNRYDKKYGVIDWSRVHTIRLQGNNTTSNGFFYIDKLDRFIVNETEESNSYTMKYTIPESSLYNLYFLGFTGPEYGTLEIDINETKEYSINFNRILEVGASTIFNGTQETFWNNVNEEQVSLESMIIPNNEIANVENHLLINVEEENRKYGTLLERDYSGIQDWSQDKYITLWFKGNGTNINFALQVSFNQSYKDFARFVFTDDSTNWRQLVFKLDEPNLIEGKLDWSRVWRLTFVSLSKDVTGQFSLGPIHRATDINKSLGREFEWSDPETLFLEKGDHSFTFRERGKIYIEKLALVSTSDPNGVPYPDIFNKEDSGVDILSFEKLNSTSYHVKVKASEPFQLAFSEAYNPNWKVYINHEKTASIPAYSFINSFFIDRMGEYDVIIKFTGQTYMFLGMLISLVSTLLTGLIITLDIRWSLRQSEKLNKKYLEGN